MKKSKQTAMAGMLCALSVVLLFLGTVLWIFTYTAPLLCGFVMIVLTQSVSKQSAWLCYVAASIISVALLSDKECALCYAFFFGYYPMLKEKLDLLPSKAVRILLKLLLFNGGIVSSQLVLIYVFGIPFDNMFGKMGVALMLVAANVIFFFYENLLVKLTVIYQKKYKQKVDAILK